MSTWRRRTKFCRSKNSEFRSTFASKTIFSWRFFRARRAETPQARRASERAVLETPARLRRFARGGVTLPCARREARGVPPRTGALPRAVGAVPRHIGRSGAGVRITTTDMTSHDKVREGELRGCAEAAFRAMRGSSERAMRDCSLIVGYPHGASSLFARTRSDDVPRCDFRATRQDVGRVVSRVPRVSSADALESTSSPARSGTFVRDAERVQTFPMRVRLPPRRDRRVD